MHYIKFKFNFYIFIIPCCKLQLKIQENKQIGKAQNISTGTINAATHNGLQQFRLNFLQAKGRFLIAP